MSINDARKLVKQQNSSTELMTATVRDTKTIRVGVEILLSYSHRVEELKDQTIRELTCVNLDNLISDVRRRIDEIIKLIKDIETAMPKLIESKKSHDEEYDRWYKAQQMYEAKLKNLLREFCDAESHAKEAEAEYNNAQKKYNKANDKNDIQKAASAATAVVSGVVGFVCPPVWAVTALAVAAGADALLTDKDIEKLRREMIEKRERCDKIKEETEKLDADLKEARRMLEASKRYQSQHSDMVYELREAGKKAEQYRKHLIAIEECLVAIQNPLTSVKSIIEEIRGDAKERSVNRYLRHVTVTFDELRAAWNSNSESLDTVLACYKHVRPA